jgi:hypothetical protein
MYENGKLRPVEIIPGMGRREKKRMMEKMNSTMIHCKNFVSVTMYPSRTIII